MVGRLSFEAGLWIESFPGRNRSHEAFVAVRLLDRLFLLCQDEAFS